MVDHESGKRKGAGREYLTVGDSGSADTDNTDEHGQARTSTDFEDRSVKVREKSVFVRVVRVGQAGVFRYPYGHGY